MFTKKKNYLFAQLGSTLSTVFLSFNYSFLNIEKIWISRIIKSKKTFFETNNSFKEIAVQSLNFKLNYSVQLANWTMHCPLMSGSAALLVLLIKVYNISHSNFYRKGCTIENTN